MHISSYQFYLGADVPRERSIRKRARKQRYARISILLEKTKKKFSGSVSKSEDNGNS